MKLESRKVLVAEDNIVLGDVIQFNLQRAGFDVTLARNGNDAIRLLESEPFSMLVTDYEMPGLDGEQICDRVRNEMHLDSLRIVVCSARGHELDREALKAKFSLEAILFKPFSIRDLMSLLESLVLLECDSTPNTVTCSH
ncbi:MAG: response regulator [Pirellula sp.]|jgi:CheY-like chemotaxis protein|nr:response regulator [Pirellula sp.]